MRLGYTEKEIFDMTPKKFFLLYDEYREMNGLASPVQGGIDAMP